MTRDTLTRSRTHAHLKEKARALHDCLKAINRCRKFRELLVETRVRCTETCPERQVLRHRELPHRVSQTGVRFPAVLSFNCNLWVRAACCIRWAHLCRIYRIVLQHIMIGPLHDAYMHGSRIGHELACTSSSGTEVLRPAPECIKLRQKALRRDRSNLQPRM